MSTRDQRVSAVHCVRCLYWRHGGVHTVWAQVKLLASDSHCERVKVEFRDMRCGLDWTGCRFGPDAGISEQSVRVCTNNQFISHREGSNHTSEPKYKLSPSFLFSCIKTAVYSHSANWEVKHLVLHTGSHFIFVGLSGRDQQSESKRSACGHAAVLNIPKPRARA